MAYEPTWKLGDGPTDMDENENMLDGFTLYDVILAVHCNYPKEKRDEAAVRAVVADIVSQRLDDMRFILDKNATIIAKRARE